MSKERKISYVTEDPYSGRRDEVLRASLAIYSAGMVGEEPDPIASTISPVVSGDVRRDMYRAAELTTSARVAARIASAMDQFERAKGLHKIAPAIELLGTRVIQYGEYTKATQEGGIVQTLRLPTQVEELTENLR